MEIYEDRVRDLLYDPSQGEAQGYNPNDLVVREDEDGRTIIDSVELIPVTDEEQIYAKKEVTNSKRYTLGCARLKRRARFARTVTLSLN